MDFDVFSQLVGQRPKLPWRAALILLCHADFNMLLVWYTFVAIPSGTRWEFSKGVVWYEL